MYQRPFALLAAAGVCISLTACSEAWRAWWERHDGPGGGGAAGSPAEQACGGRLGDTCSEDQYCDYPPEAICGRADGNGVCTAKPGGCTKEYQPVCGCDGQTYGNACTAAAAGVSVESEGECGAQPQSCKLGDTEFATGDGVICSDGCNQCACDEQGRWISTLSLCAPLPKVEACDPRAESTPGLAITKLYRAEDALALSVSHGGGCFEHSFKLCYTPAFAESNPVQTQLWLVDQSAEPDPCLALITRELVFDLSPIREQYSAQYPSGPDQIVLNLGRERIEYQF